MIENLTKKQKALLSVYRDKWLEIGLSTKPANKVLAEEGIQKAYQIAGISVPKIVWVASPLSAGLTRMIILNLKNLDVRSSVRDFVESSVWSSVEASVKDSVWSSVRDSVEASVWDSVEASVGYSVWDFVRNSVGDSVWASVEASVWPFVRDSVRASVWDSVEASVWSVRTSVEASVWDSVEASVGYSVWDSVRASVYGQHDASWLGFYDYFYNVLVLKKETEKLIGLWQIVQNAGWWLPYKEICWVSERHNVCRLKNGKIHCETGPSIAYIDGFEIYGLNGVRVPKELVMTPWDKLDVQKWFLDEKNAEIRKEVVRKIGLERICQKIPTKKLDQLCDYELLSFTVHGQNRIALKMVNPSTRTYHIEYIPPEIQTVESALNWRNQTTERPVILT